VSPYIRKLSYNPPVAFSYIQYLRGAFRPIQLESLFLFVTSACNSKCRTCFYWDELNQGRDLTLEQLESLSRTAPQFHKLWISGGEPFLRKELAQIVELFYHNNRVRHINLPTNGLLPERMEQAIEYLLDRCPELVIDLNFSLDGLANTHDVLRGVPNNFRKTLESVRLASARWSGIRRLRRNLVTCVTRDNYQELVRLGLEMLRDTDSSGHYFEIIRGNPLDPGLKKLPREELRSLHRRLLWFHQRYAAKLFAHLPKPARFLARAWYLGNVKLHFDIHERNHYGNQPWPMSCTAGQTTIVVDHDGSFRACELRPKLGQLADYGFNLAAALSSQAMRQEVAAIPAAQCWCTHSCWIHSSSKFSPKVLLFHIPWSWIKSRWDSLPRMEIEQMERFLVADAPSSRYAHA
jgi:MoaA/NifB/PqqE/SkfB family radical SAM enzyme